MNKTELFGLWMILDEKELVYAIPTKSGKFANIGSNPIAIEWKRVSSKRLMPITNELLMAIKRET